MDKLDLSCSNSIILKSHLFIQMEHHWVVIRPPLNSIDKSEKHFKKMISGFVLLDKSMTKQIVLAKNI